MAVIQVDAFPIGGIPVDATLDAKKQSAAKKKYCVGRLKRAYDIFTAPSSTKFDLSDINGPEVTGMGYQDPRPYDYSTLTSRLKDLADKEEAEDSASDIDSDGGGYCPSGGFGRPVRGLSHPLSSGRAAVSLTKADPVCWAKFKQIVESIRDYLGVSKHVSSEWGLIANVCVSARV